jgi:predicted alpha-1,2-mannosidase
MKCFQLLLLISFFCIACSDVQTSKKAFIPDQPPEVLVNPLVGSQSTFALSNGNTYPAIAVPWGMNFWSPQTGKMGSGWFYNYSEHKIRGIRQTRQPSPWINDYGAFSIMPVTGELKITEDERASWFSHKSETVKPYYYQVYLGDYDVNVELAPTDRAAQFRITYPESENSYFIVDAFFKGSKVVIDQANQRISGFSRNHSGGVPFNFHNYFILEFDKPFRNVHTWKDGELQQNNQQSEGNHVMAIIEFATSKGEQVNVKVASSFISPEQAAINLNREIGTKNFQTTMQEAKDAWNKELSRIKIEGGDLDQHRTFYTALYRTLLFPRKFYEFNENEEMVHYSPYNGEVLPGYMFTDNGFWDTFRAVFPFFTVMYPEMNNQIMKGLVNAYKESGWLPEWASPGHRDCMIGSNSASLIADAYIKGMRDYDIETLYEAILKNADHEGPVTSVGRYGVEYYNTLGFIPYDVGVHENTARTLEYAYADFAVWKLAKALDKPQDDINRFKKQSQYYHNVFDPRVNFMRGRNQDGSFQEPFNEYRWGDAFTEGNSWHYTWAVFHDPAGLADLMGGREAFADKLESMFTTPPYFDFSYYGIQIHEITEMVIANMGQYAHGNQPIQHGIYLFNYVGRPWVAQKWVREVLDRLYTPLPDGLCGDEDNGQTSAWYVFSALGFYPVCPGQPEYVIGSPLFEKATIQLENGNTFVIEAQGNNRDNIYIQSAMLNNTSLEKNWISHEDIQKGGKLVFQMANKPNKQRGTKEEHAPYSMSREN